MSNGTMLILPDWPGPLFAQYNADGILDRESAKAYATKLGYTPRVIDYPYIQYRTNPQFLNAFHIINTSDVTGLYGMGGALNNIRTIWEDMKPDRKELITKIILLNASPGVDDFPGIKPGVLFLYNPPDDKVAYLDLPKWVLNNA